MNNELCLEINDTSYYGLSAEFIKKSTVLDNADYYTKDTWCMNSLKHTLNTESTFDNCILCCMDSCDTETLILDISSKELLLESLQLLRANESWYKHLFGKLKIIKDAIKLLQDNSKLDDNTSISDIVYERFITNINWYLEDDKRHLLINDIFNDDTFYGINELSFYLKDCPGSTYFMWLFKDPKEFREYVFNCAAYKDCECPVGLLEEFGDNTFKNISCNVKRKAIHKQLREKEKEIEELEQEVKELKQQLEALTR